VSCLGAHDGPRTIADVAHDTGLSRRDVEAELEELRRNGEPIVAGADGIQLTNDPDELDRTVDQRRRRAVAIHRGTLALRSTVRRLRGGDQQSLWGSA
jgi:biotin operon repressor